MSDTDLLTLLTVTSSTEFKSIRYGFAYSFICSSIFVVSRHHPSIKVKNMNVGHPCIMLREVLPRKVGKYFFQNFYRIQINGIRLNCDVLRNALATDSVLLVFASKLIKFILCYHALGLPCALLSHGNKNSLFSRIFITSHAIRKDLAQRTALWFFSSFAEFLNERRVDRCLLLISVCVFSPSLGWDSAISIQPKHWLHINKYRAFSFRIVRAMINIKIYLNCLHFY